MGTFSFLSRSDRELIDATAAQAEASKRLLEQNVDARRPDFPAKLTAFDSASGYYSWTRRAFDAGVRYDHPAAVQVGTATSNPAKFPNGDVITAFPADVWLRPVGIDPAVGGVGMVHEVVTTPAATPTFSGAAAYSSVDQVGGAGGPLSFNTTTFDTGSYFSIGDPTHLVFPSAGYYLYGVEMTVVAATGMIAEVAASFFGPTGAGATASGYVGASIVPGFGSLSLSATGLVHAVGADYLQFISSLRSAAIGTFTVKAGSGFWVTKVG